MIHFLQEKTDSKIHYHVAPLYEDAQHKEDNTGVTVQGQARIDADTGNQDDMVGVGVRKNPKFLPRGPRQKIIPWSEGV